MIDERKLDRLQTTARRLAALSLVVFVALIGYSAYRLYGIQQELRRSSEELHTQREELRRNEQRLEGLQAEIAELEETRRALSGALTDFSATVGDDNPMLALEATRRAIETNPAAASALPRIYVHVRREEQRRPAKRIAERLRESRFLVPGIENVGNRSPRRTELRHFHRNDVESTDLRAILSVLQQAGIEVEPKFVPGFEEAGRVPPRQYELWFGEGFPPAGGHSGSQPPLTERLPASATRKP